jgi:hypothetical protein
VTARAVGVLALVMVSWPSRLKLLADRSEVFDRTRGEWIGNLVDLLLVSRGPNGPGLSLRRIVVPERTARNAPPSSG